VKLRFLGAAGEVTGSCYLVDTGALRFLIECGMRQGGRQARALNRRFDFAPRDIAFVLLSHAHIDHSGLLPRLVAQGRTPIATRCSAGWESSAVRRRRPGWCTASPPRRTPCATPSASASAGAPRCPGRDRPSI